MRLEKMTAVVTGGASGMGESICYALAKEGASIVVVDKNLDGAELVAHADHDVVHVLEGRQDKAGLALQQEV